MLKKVLKAVAALEARVKKTKGTRLSAGAPLLKKLQKAAVDLEGRAKQHDLAAITAREAAKNLRDLLSLSGKIEKPALTKAAKKTTAKAKRTSKPTPRAQKKAPAKSATHVQAKPTLAAAIEHVLTTRREQKADGVNASQLYVEVQQAGYQFGSDNVENRMNYLHKILRQHKARFKRAADGTIALA